MKRVNRVFLEGIFILLIVVVCKPVSCFAGDDEWLGIESKNYDINIRYGSDDLGSNLLGFGVGAQTYRDSHVNLDYMSVDVSKYYSVNWTSDPLALWSVALSYELSKESTRFRSEDYNLRVQVYPNNWSYGLGFGAGALEVLSRDSEKKSFDMFAAYESVSWGASVSASKHFYDKKDEMRQFLRRLQHVIDNLPHDVDTEEPHLTARNKERINRILSNTGVVNRLYQLSNWEVTLATSYHYHSLALGLGVEYFETLIEEETWSEYFFSAGYTFGDNIDLAYQLSFYDESSYGELILGYRW